MHPSTNDSDNHDDSRNLHIEQLVILKIRREQHIQFPAWILHVTDTLSDTLESRLKNSLDKRFQTS